MSQQQKNNPLHGVTLDMMINYLYNYYGWDGLYKQLPVKCFINNPSVKSSLSFLRKTPWARLRLETIFIYITRNGIDEHLFKI